MKPTIKSIADAANDTYTAYYGVGLPDEVICNMIEAALSSMMPAYDLEFTGSTVYFETTGKEIRPNIVWNAMIKKILEDG